MTLPKKAVSVLYDHARAEGGIVYGSLIDEPLKGGISYKMYFKMLDKNKFAQDAGYGKLVYPSKEEIIISPLPKLKEALQQSNEVALVRYEFAKKQLGRQQHLFILKVGDMFFDIPESMAHQLSNQFGITLQISE